MQRKNAAMIPSGCKPETSETAPTSSYGALNGHAIGIIMKELVRRAMVTIQNEMHVFEVTEKVGYDGLMDDMFTSADTKAQAVIMRSLLECFPDFGIVAEENKHYKAPANGITAHFTLDPLDGTKAFVREEVQGVGTMLALVDGQKVVAAYVGDINTNRIYGYRPDSDHVYRISGFETFKQLNMQTSLQTAARHILLRDPLGDYASHLSVKTAERFKSYQVQGGSIGTWFARLWTGAVGALMVPPGKETPWDSSPVIGITNKLGYGFYRPSEKGDHWEAYAPRLSLEIYDRGHDTLVAAPATVTHLEAGWPG